MIKDILNLQGDTIKLLEEGLTLLLETKKGRKLVVKLNEKGKRKK